ncbi:MAG: NIPSNAP family protein [Flavobacteriaceae bacterium]
MKKIFLLVSLFICVSLFGQNEVYELRTYELFQTSSFKNFNTYFEDHFIPALNDRGIENIGVFQEVSEDLPRKIYVFIPYPNLEVYRKTHVALANDSKIRKASVVLNPKEKPMFNRYQTSLYEAFDEMPSMVKPDNDNRFFELRTYESHSEDAYRRKVNMFNEGELELFDQLDFGSVFFGDKIAGERMPCLTYMLSFESLKERNENWSQFFDHPTWTKLKSDPAYKDSCCSSISRAFLTPMPYSQL